MTDHSLLSVLTRWIGRPATQRAFEGRGFLIHKSWQARVTQLCGEEKSELLANYWDDVAMETICSVGQGDPNARHFVVQPKFRSAFLDKLAAEVDFAEPPFRYPPLIKCLFKYRKKQYYDREFLFDEISRFQNLKNLKAKDS